MNARRFATLVSACLIASACGSASTPPSTTAGLDSTTTTLGTVVPLNAATAYRTWCSACHGSFGGGEPGGSEIIDVPGRYDGAALEEVIRSGFATMAGTPNIPSEEISLIIEYVLNDFSVVPQGD